MRRNQYRLSQLPQHILMFVLPLLCYLAGTLLGANTPSNRLPALLPFVFLLAILFYAAFSLFGVFLSSCAMLAFGYLSGGCFIYLFQSFSFSHFLLLFPLAFLLAPCFLLLAVAANGSSLFLIRHLAMTEHDTQFRALARRLFLCLAAAGCALFFCRILLSLA